MKRDYLIIGLIAAIIFVLLLIVSCSEGGYTPGKMNLLQNRDQRNEAFNQIMQNQEVMTDLMNRVSHDPLAMQWMMQDSILMHHMLSMENFNYMMSEYPSLQDTLMQNMAGMLNNNHTSMMQWNSLMQVQGHPGAMMNQVK